MGRVGIHWAGRVGSGALDEALALSDLRSGRLAGSQAAEDAIDVEVDHAQWCLQPDSVLRRGPRRLELLAQSLRLREKTDELLTQSLLLRGQTDDLLGEIACLL